MESRLSTYLHPVAGRPLCWHTLAALAGAKPAPERLLLVAGSELSPDLFADLPVPVEVVRPDSPQLADARASIAGSVVVTEAAAPGIAAGLPRLLDAPERAVLVDSAGAVAAVKLPAELAESALHGGGLPGGELVREARDAPIESPLAFVVRNRRDLARASAHVRDQVVRRIMAGGASFLLPDTVLVDVDVQVGRDTIVYPGVILEGHTQIGEETVVGPGCRIVDSWIGSGVELKGWNFISHTSIRNRAILEPYVRRGFD